jgi:lysophospholipid acyltransferase (LPLAT)-like uncharacterized protein
MQRPHDDARARWVGRLGALCLRALGATWRTRRIGDEHAAACRATGAAFVYSFWHAQLLPLAYLKRNRGVVILVSLSRDGEYITQVIERMGYGTVRGSTTRGGFRSLVEAAQLGRAGRTLGFTPDGPRGPRHRVQPGILLCAQRAGIPILPIAASAWPRRRLASWDRFLIPAPFARVVVVQGEPLRVPADLDATELVAQWTPRLEAAMLAVCERAESEVRAWARVPPDPLAWVPAAD